ncbi:uncharacterized protein LOC144477928 [Augochlora pura]
MEMKTGVPYPTTPPTYSETTMTSPQPTSMIPPLLPRNHQYMPHPPSPSPYQPEPTSNIHNPPYQVPPWVPRQPPIGNPDTSLTEISIAQQHPSSQNNPTVVHVVADAGYHNMFVKYRGRLIACFSLMFLITGIVITVIFATGVSRFWSESRERIAIAA